MALPAANNNPDSFFVTYVRRIIRDQGNWKTDPFGTDGLTGTTLAASKPFRTQRAPVLKNPLTALTAPGATYKVVFETTPASTIAPVLSDGGAGALAAGNYQVAYTVVAGGVESGPSPVSNTLGLAANRQLSIGALTGLASTVTSINVYLVNFTAPGSIGLLGSITVTSGATVATTFNAYGNGTLPVLIVSDTGEIFFATAPPSGSLSITYQTAVFSDQEITDSLYEGLRAMFPELWQPVIDTSLTPSVTAYEYTLPAVFTDPRVQILEVEIRDPNITLLPYRKYDRWERVGLSTLFLYEIRFSPAGNIRITYNGQYSTLGDTETQVMHLPCYFAAHRLMADQETYRTRDSELVPMAGAGGSQPGVATQIADYWMQKFEREKQRFARRLPIAMHQQLPLHWDKWRDAI